MSAPDSNSQQHAGTPDVPEYDYDVFISYSHKDEDWVVETLLPRLEGAGLRVCIDFRDFEPGKAALHNMRDAVKRSRRSVFVLTENWVASEWTGYESVLVRTADPAGLRQTTIPLLREKCTIPEDIAVLTHVDFTNAKREDLAWRQLLTALGAPPEPEAACAPSREQWFLAHPYAMPPCFTGRTAERALLANWLVAEASPPLLVLRALGGFGKSALVWHWLLHDVDPATWPRVVWWSFYEGDASFESFLAKTLHYLTGGRLDVGAVPLRDQLEELLRLLYHRGTLLILDGFERALRAFGGIDAAYQGDDERSTADNGRDCISPLAEVFLRSAASLPGIRGRVLMTTRLRPAAVETRDHQLLGGCREEELTQLQPADAVEFFQALGIRGTRTEIQAACKPYGYHPLSLRLLAGWIKADLQQPGDVAAARRLDVSGNLVQRQHHVLEQAYDALQPTLRQLLGRIACFRGPVRYEALEALAEEKRRGDAGTRGRGDEEAARGPGSGAGREFDSDLRDLVDRGLLHRDLPTNRFDLHPIVRRCAYDRLTAKDLTGAHAQLRDYFAAVPTPDKVQTLDDLAPVIELYHHTVRAGQYDEACALFLRRLHKVIYYRLGAYQLQIELLRALFPDGENRPPQLKNESHQSHTLSALANSYSLSGQPRRAVPLYEQLIAFVGVQGNKKNLAISLGNVADDRLKTGELRAAEANLLRRIVLCREIKDDFREAVGHQELGRLLAYRGEWDESKRELATSTRYWEAIRDLQGLGLDESYLALCELLRARSEVSSLRSQTSDSQSALASAHRALEVADEQARNDSPIERDYVCAYWLLGAAHCMAREADEAERHLDEALQRCRRINLVDHEADILIDLARLRVATGAMDEARRLASEALAIAERCGYVLQGADAHLVLAQLAQAKGDSSDLRHHAAQAQRLASCDGPPDYTYKVAYDEATALLAMCTDS